MLSHVWLFVTPWTIIRLFHSWNSPGKNTGMGSHSLLQVIFLTQGWNPGLLLYRWILYHLSHQGSPMNCVVLYVFIHWSLRKAFLSLLAILWNSAFKWAYVSFSHLPFTNLLFTAICKASSDNHFALCISFSWGRSWSLPPIQCHEPPSIVLQALCLSDLILWIYFSFPLYNCKGFDLGPTWMV